MTVAPRPHVEVGRRRFVRRRVTISARELADRLGVHRGTINTWRKNGKLVAGVHFVMVEGEPAYLWPMIWADFRPR